jgi:hypothetical protein
MKDGDRVDSQTALSNSIMSIKGKVGFLSDLLMGYRMNRNWLTILEAGKQWQSVGGTQVLSSNASQDFSQSLIFSNVHFGFQSLESPESF